MNPKWSWGDCSTIEGILTHVLRSEYGTFSLASGHSSQSITKNLVSNFGFFAREFGWPTLISAFVSLAFIYRRNFRQTSSILPFIWLFAFYTLFFAWRSNLDPTNNLYYGVVQRFYLQNSIIVVYLACLTLNELLNLCKVQRTTEISAAACVIIIALRYQRNDYSKFEIVENFGNSHITAFPPNSVVLMKVGFRMTELFVERINS